MRKGKILFPFMIGMAFVLAACMPSGPLPGLPDTGEDLLPTQAATEAPTQVATQEPAETSPAATAEVTAAATDAPAATAPADGEAESISIDGLSSFTDALSTLGARLSAGVEVSQPFFPARGQEFTVNGASVQVFEFDDEVARQDVSNLITEEGSVTGFPVAPWPDQPNIWATGRVIVLYVGQDQATIDLLGQALGQPVTSATQLSETGAGQETGGVGVGQNPAAQAVRDQVAEQAGLSHDAVEIVSVEQQEWSDACLGLGQANESCLQALTPGWQVVVSANGQDFVFRTDWTGQQVRQVLDEEDSVTGEDFTPGETADDEDDANDNVQGIPSSDPPGAEPFQPTAAPSDQEDDQPAAGEDAPSGSQGTQGGAADEQLNQVFNDLVGLLQLAGAQVQNLDRALTTTLPGFSIPGRQITLNGEDLRVFIYSSEQDARTDAAKVSPAGDQVGQSRLDLGGNARFYRTGSIIILYVGSNPQIVTLLNSVAGPPFAGG